MRQGTHNAVAGNPAAMLLEEIVTATWVASDEPSNYNNATRRASP